MGFDYYGGIAAMPDDGSTVMAAALIVYLVLMLLSFAYSILVYVLQSLGFYSIAKRRGIHNPWLAWIPVGNMWILGSISDQYQYVAKGRVKNRRKTLLGLQIAMTVCMILIFALAFVLGFSAAQSEMAEMSVNMDMGMHVNISNADLGAGSVGIGLLVMVAYLAMMVIAIVLAVYQYIAYYDLFTSCSPNNNVLFLVLSILFNVTLPYFVFALRKKDGGMPPRRVQVPVAPWTPAPPPPAPQWQPEEPVAEPVEEPASEETED